MRCLILFRQRGMAAGVWPVFLNGKPSLHGDSSQDDTPVKTAPEMCQARQKSAIFFSFQNLHVSPAAALRTLSA